MSRRGVFDDCCAAGGRCSCDGDGNGVAGCERDAGEIVGVVGIPFKPRVVGDCAGRGEGPVNARLEDGAAACCAVDAYPRGARADGCGSRDFECSCYGVVAYAD